MDILLLQAKIDALAKRMYPVPLPDGPSIYFISLENDCMFLHLSLKKPADQILKECEDTYEYAKVNRPVKIVYEMKPYDIYEVDTLVKKFMHMFGQDKTRGGSYTSIELNDHQVNTLKSEFDFVNQYTNSIYYTNK